MSPAAQGPSVLIFGATGGIGSALARNLSVSGYRLTLAARDSNRLGTLAGELQTDACSVDATDSAAVERCFFETAEKHGRLDGVVNCVGSLFLKPAHATQDADWAAVMAANLTSSFYVLRAATRLMMRSGGGSIVLLASAVAQRGMINHEAIAAAKAGVVGLALSGAATYARYHIRVNCVAPGLTRTPLTASLTTNEVMLKASAALHPLGRVGEPEEVARAIAWFVAPENSWVTGQVLAVDGGLSTVQSRGMVAA
ncbi:MAG TPA: SDR family oxidoreductase [Verrucomicrobiae bacterium]|nr:SDR family oxidoreductase [Verrucomicrobiae bacterium]